MIDYSVILTNRYPGCEWTLTGPDYSDLVWHCTEHPVPTKAILDALWPTVQADLAKMQRDRLRRAAYAESADPVFFKWQRGEATESDWLAAVAAVKAQFPA